MDDFFGKEITPFAKIVTNEHEAEGGNMEQTRDMDPGKMNMTLKDRWKFIDSGIGREFLSFYVIVLRAIN